jgi:hypothetical protein
MVQSHTETGDDVHTMELPKDELDVRKDTVIER